MKIEKRNPKIELPDGLELCDDCGHEFEKDEIKACSYCKRRVCKFCMDLHSEEHYLESIKENIEEDEEIIERKKIRQMNRKMGF